MRTKTRLTAIALLPLLGGLAACGSNDDTKDASSTPPAVSSPTATPTETPSETPSETSTALEGIPADFAGTWTGVVTDTDTHARITVRLIMRAGARNATATWGTGMHCQARLWPKTRSGARLATSLDGESAAADCETSGQVSYTLIDPDHLRAVAVGGNLGSATGTLHRA